MNIEYELNSMKKMMERRLLFIEITLSKINVSIQSLEKELTQTKAALMVYHGADPNI